MNYVVIDLEMCKVPKLYRRNYKHANETIEITVMITSYIGRNPLQMTNRQRTVPMIVAHPKKHIIISTTIVTVILIHLTAIIQEKIHMEHLVPQQSVHTILMMRGMMTSIWMVIMMITDMIMTVTMQMV